MSKQVKWNKKIYDRFVEEAMLSEEEQNILKTRIENVPISVQSSMFGMSESSVHRCISRLKKKYDEVQKLHPNDFPVRKKSAKETWMDNN